MQKKTTGESGPANDPPDFAQVRVVDDSWHLRKEITVGQIATMLTVLVALVTWGTSVETRITQINGDITRVQEVTEVQYEALENKLKSYRGHVTSSFNKIDKKLTRIEDKLDQKADK